jgi:hypothetical protein
LAKPPDRITPVQGNLLFDVIISDISLIFMQNLDFSLRKKRAKIKGFASLPYDPPIYSLIQNQNMMYLRIILI